MNDKELLELAAKSVGLEWLSYHHVKGLCCRDDKHGWLIEYYWNPLIDDGDAFRLAIDACVDAHTQIAGRQVYAEAGFDDVKILNLINDDKYAALRRCITQAAAEIGKGM